MSDFVSYKSEIRFGLPLGTEWVAYLASMQAIFTPTEWQGDGSKPLLMYSMGSGSTWETMFNLDLVNPAIRTALAAGCAVVVSPFGGDQFGNATARNLMTNAFDYCRANVGVGPKAILAGFSMGSLNALNWAGNNPTKTKSIWVAGPLCDIESFITSGGKSAMDAAYGATWTEAAFGATSNPKTMATAGKYNGIPIKIMYSSNDPVLAPATALAFGVQLGSPAINLGALGHDWNIANAPKSIAALVQLLS